ncbi:hypothetical protein [Haloarcula sp. JP-L23]|uniref:hypothetical protein n=1 Tax=Haloarcula sp. JP-L23 TaxID=2716717 RepID=UPI00140EC1BC|nr:hypothetical protein G9465_06940 [Haloarcula sp. JP-L23]
MVQNGYGVDANHDHDYRCRHCGATFDELVERPTKNTPGRSGSLAGRLEDPDPEDVGEPAWSPDCAGVGGSAGRGTTLPPRRPPALATRP